MLRNMGTADRLIRALVAIVIAGAWFAGLIHGALAIVLGVFAVVFAITASIAWCPAYMPLGITTRPKPAGNAPARM